MTTPEQAPADQVRENPFMPERIEAAERETERLMRELDITSADHIALWLEANMADSSLDWLACRLVEAHESVLLNPPQHSFWGAGEADCPRDIKAGNGELHTLRCKRCGLDNPGHTACFGVRQPQPTPGDGERGAVVAWLRGEGGNFQSPVARDIVRQIAAEIERGDHLSSDAGKQS